jgi:hypothetical protein
VGQHIPVLAHWRVGPENEVMVREVLNVSPHVAHKGCCRSTSRALV